MKFSDLNNLDFQNAGSWPPLAKAIAVLMLSAAVLGLGYWFDTSQQLSLLEQARANERQLRQEFIEKQRVMANLDDYRAQLETMQGMLNNMLRQLPTRTEMSELLENISNIGKRSGLNFELFKPEEEQPRDFYAAKPISIKARASYHQFGAFISNIAAHSRIVTLESMTLGEPPAPTGAGRANLPAARPGDANKPLLIEASLQTYRYLEEQETTAAAGRQDKAGAAKP